MALQKTEELNNSGVFFDYHRIDGGEFSVTPEGITATFRAQGFMNEEARSQGKGPVTTRWISVKGDHSVLGFLYEVFKTAPEMSGAKDILEDDWKLPPETIEPEEPDANETP